MQMQPLAPDLHTKRGVQASPLYLPEDPRESPYQDRWRRLFVAVSADTIAVEAAVGAGYANAAGSTLADHFDMVR